jgi:hypothetical protein
LLVETAVGKIWGLNIKHFVLLFLIQDFEAEEQGLYIQDSRRSFRAGADADAKSGNLIV